MSTKNSTPTSSPKPPKIVRVDAPLTPPAAKNKKLLSAGLSTPDPLHDTIPFSPGLKRSNSGSARSPEQGRGEVASPYSAHNLLKTPGNPDDDSDGTPRRAKLMKTPQFFSPGKRLFAEDSSPTKKELGEISSQLKSRLSSAFGSLQQREKAGSTPGLGISPGVSPVRLDFSSGSFHPGKESPTRMSSATLRGEGSPPAALGRTNINLQTLQASPSIDASPRVPSRSHSRTHSRHTSADLGTSFSPVLGSEAYFHSRKAGMGPVAMPSPDEESSAQTALLVALSRVQERRRSHSSGLRRPSLGNLGGPAELHSQQHHASNAYPLKLPPISVQQPKRDGASEEDAVYSLMSLSSPQQAKHDLHTLHSVASMQAGAFGSSAESSRSSSVVMPVMPPVPTIRHRMDDDETDIEDSDESDGEETG